MKFHWKENGRPKLYIGLGTRPEIIRLAATIRRCREYFKKTNELLISNQTFHIQ